MRLATSEYLRLFFDLNRIIATYPAVNLDLVSYPTTKELVDRHLELSSLQVPEPNVDARKCRLYHWSVAIKAVSPDELPNMLNVAISLIRRWVHGT